MESFLVALAMAILKYYGPKVAVQIEKTWKEYKELQDNEEKAKVYEKVINSPADRAERKKIEDDLLS